jgi:beta-lactam-binding protein with PASTA domain
MIGSNVDDAKQKLRKDGFEVRTVGKGDVVVSQIPAYNQSMPKNGVIVLYTETDAERDMTTVPDLRGMSVSLATKTALASGLNIKISGNALNAGELSSYDQNFKPGEPVECGKTITVYFKSDTGVGDYAG